MNGPQHVAEAERLEKLALVQWDSARADDPTPLAVLTMQQARLHADLALVAATVAAAAHPGQSQVDYLGEWFEVFS